MAKTKSFDELVQQHVKRDAKFAQALLARGRSTRCCRATWRPEKTILRDYIKATVGFEKLGAATPDAAEEPDPHVRPARQSAGQESFQRDRLPAKARGRAASRRAASGVASSPD